MNQPPHQRVSVLTDDNLCQAAQRPVQHNLRPMTGGKACFSVSWWGALISLTALLLPPNSLANNDAVPLTQTGISMLNAAWPPTTTLYSNTYANNTGLAAISPRVNALAPSLTVVSNVQQDGLIDTQQSQLLGEWALRQINAEAPLITDPWLQQSLENIVWQINATARADAPMALVVINDRQINAFAVPAGVIGINVGLLDKARTLDEVASVIAHEIAHVSQRHYQHRNDEKTKHLLMQVGGMLAGVAAASAGDGEAGTALIMGAQTMSANSAAAFSRDQEREADRVGMQIMAQAGYDVSAMPSFFATLNQQNPVKANAFIPSFVMSHPLTSERLSEARERANQYQKPGLGQKISYRQQLFDRIQWRARYLAHLTNKAELIQAAKTSDGAKLALAMQLIDERQFAEASRQLAPFAVSIAQLTDPLAVIVAARLDEAQGNSQATMDKLTRLSDIMPERRDIKLYLSDSYLNHQPTPAHAAAVLRLLQPLSKQSPKDIAVWQRLQQASQILAKTETGQAKTLQQINVLRYRAFEQLWRNQLNDAVTSITQAKLLTKQLPHSNALVASLNEQLSQVQQANQFKPS